MCFHMSRVSLQIALSIVRTCQYSEGTIEHIRVGSDMLLFAGLPISCVEIISIYI